MNHSRKWKNRSFERVYCSHCEKQVSKSTFYSHHAQFYDQETGIWKKSELPSAADFEFCDSESDHIESNDNNTDPDDNDDFGYEEIDTETTDSVLHATNKEPEENAIELWDSDCEELDNTTIITPNASVLKFVKFVSGFLLLFQAVFRIPDSAMNLLFKFFRKVLLMLSQMLHSADLKSVQDFLPENLPQALKLKNIDRDGFKKLVMCEKCFTTYDREDCEQGSKCRFVRFPRHPQRRMRMPCSSSLFKTVKTASRKCIAVPLKEFCYKSIIKSIKQLFMQTGKIELFNQWKKREIPIGVLADIYDGAVWKEFLVVDGKDFLADRYSLGLLINVDWFRPFKHLQYSVGAIYIAILNYPRNIRFLKENMLVIGIIPGPHEPSLHINSFLEPFVQELQQLWKGIEINTSEGIRTVRAALLCNSSDVPTTRKVAGFVGHAAVKGCSRCLKSFPTAAFGEKADYSGFNVADWPERTVQDHKSKGMEWKHARTLAQRNSIEREHGVRYTELLRLPYFNPARFTVVDPMHNVLLGTSKLMITLWREKSFLSDHDCADFQAVVDTFVVPPDIGRIPYKIVSGFASLTADQWKNWVLIYSLIILKGKIPQEQYECWSHFVKASRLLCSRAITMDNISVMHTCFVQFCTLFEQLFGKEACTPNLHLHCHLKDCLSDFGPGSAFWLFACERMNGILGSVPTNHHQIEIQLMRKFNTTQQVLGSADSYDDEIRSFFQSYIGTKGSLKQDSIAEIPFVFHRTSARNFATTFTEQCELLYPIKEGCFSTDELALIDQSLSSQFGEGYKRTLMLHKYSSGVRINGELYGSCNSLHFGSAMLYAKHYQMNPNKSGLALKYVLANVILEDTNLEGVTCNVTIPIILTSIWWLAEHEHKTWYGQAIEVYQSIPPNLSTLLPHSFIPAANITCKCAHISKQVDFDTVVGDYVTIVVALCHFHGL